MPKLTATYEITLPEPFLCEYPEGKKYEPLSADDRLFHLNINGFDVEIELGNFSGSGKGRVDLPMMATEIKSVTFRVARDESEPPPVVKPAENGTIDLSPLQDYLWDKQKQHIPIVEQLIERLSIYFRFRAGQPLVRLHPEGGQRRFMNPTWTDEAGNKIWDRDTRFRFGGSASLRLYPHMDVTAYKPEDRDSLLAALEKPLEREFHEELLADAKDAVAAGNIRRAVLELAIACEVAIKHVYFERGSYADAAYSYLEEKSPGVRVLDFLNAIAFRAFGQSLKSYDPDCNQRIDDLFQCRNKIAHRGTPIFRDKKGNVRTADYALLLEWWSAVKKAIVWIKGMAARV
jgi:hypothetical protein